MSVEFETMLYKQVANLNVLYVKLHHYHWFVKGHNFFELHRKFEELYDLATEQMDELAERMLTIGQTPFASMKNYLEAASIKEASGTEENAEAMVQQTLDDYRMLSKEFHEAIQKCDEFSDHVTQDMLIGHKKQIDMQTWMLSSYLGK